jgi:hypothetical protein
LVVFANLIIQTVISEAVGDSTENTPIEAKVEMENQVKVETSVKTVFFPFVLAWVSGYS